MPTFRRSACSALFPLALLSGTFRLLAQHPVEIPHEGVRREHEVDREKDKELGPEAAGGFTIHLKPGEILRTPDEMEALDREARARQTLRWQKDPSGRPYAMDGSARVDLEALKHSLDNGRFILNEGTPPRTREWRELNAAHADQIITHEPESANRDLYAIQEAIDLGDRPLNPAKVKVFNALPHERELNAHFQEQTRMGVGGTLDYWSGLHKDIESSSGAMLPHRATKDLLLQELRSGTSDVLMLYAHFDGEHLYMSGAQGDRINIDELKQIDRTRDRSVRHRVIVLVACKTAAATPENPRSLASVLLEKGIARTVMATDRPYASHEIPALLTRLADGKTALRKAVGLYAQPHAPGTAPPATAASAQTGSFLQQYVELQAPMTCPRWAKPAEQAGL